MEDTDLLGFFEQKLDNRIRKHEQVSKKTTTINAEADEDLLGTRPILTKRVAMLLEGDGNKAKGKIGESKQEAKEREKLQKQLSFIKGQKIKADKKQNTRKKPDDEEKEEAITREKKLLLSKNNIQRNLHLFKGSRIPTPKLDHKKQTLKPKTIPKTESRRVPDAEKQARNYALQEVRRPNKVNKPIKKAKYRDISDDSAMEVRDMYAIDEENEYAFEAGKQEEEEYEKLLKLRKQYNKFRR